MPQSTTATPPADQPVGTPPEGGRWTWDGTEWVRQPEPPAASTSEE